MGISTKSPASGEGARTYTTTFVVKWTPRVVAMAIGGYYGLGIAYDLGLMALIDKVAIQAVKHFLGYAGVGAIMPSVQWYAAWAVRITIAGAAGLTYDLFEKIVCFCLKRPSNRNLRAEGATT